MKTGYKMVVIWTVSSLLVLSFSIPAVMSVSNSLSTNFTSTENCKGYQHTADQRSRLNPTGLKEYFKWFQEILIPVRLKEYFKRFQESSMGSLRSIFNLDRITESWNTSLNKISNIILLWFSYGFRYFRSVAKCFMMDFYEKGEEHFLHGFAC